MIFEVDNVKGFHDSLPPESLKRKAVVEIAEKNFQLYGFAPVETPVIEFDEIMKSSALPSEEDDEAVSERFRLRDRAGRNLGLRYEFTFQLSRILKQNPNMKLPLRKYQIGPVFRDEPTGQGRTRQFIQLDADIIGDSSSKADAECIALMNDILKELQIKNFEIKVSNRKLISSIIESVEMTPAKSVMRELDKLDKAGEDAVKASLKKYADSNKVLTLFKLMEKPLDFFIENAFEGVKEIEELIKSCKLYGINLKFSPSLVRGFGYYTGNMFEFSTPEKISIAGGGRYDKLAGKYLNREIPAVGISFSLERIIASYPEISLLKTAPLPNILVISISQEKESIKLAKKLRQNSLSCSVSFDSPAKSLEYANSAHIPFAIFLGELEISKKKYKLRNMSSGEESELGEKQLIKKLKAIM